MVLSNAPIQEVTSDKAESAGRFPQVWILWFQSLRASVVANNQKTFLPITVDITLGADNGVVLCDATSSLITVTLPDVLEFSGFVFTIKKTNVSGSDVAVDGNGADVEGLSTYNLTGTAQPSIEVISDGTEWFIL